MRGNKNRWIAAGLIALLLCAFCLPAAGEEYRELKLGMNGDDIQKFKVAMYWLGYFTTDNLDGNFTRTTQERVKQLQKNNGLEQTGIADAALQELVFSGNAVKTKSAPKPSPVPTPAPTPRPPLDLSGLLPARTEEGFLAKGEEEFVYVDQQEGIWIYLTPSLSIDLRRYEDTSDRKNPVVWFEADIHASPESPMTAYLTQGKKYQGKAYTTPVKLARENHVVLAFADDNFGDRWNAGNKTGVIVRNGQIIGERTFADGKGKFPNLEVLALFDDGSMKTFASDAHTAKEYIDMGAVSTYAFGPILIQDGELSEYMKRSEYYSYHEPRCAIGMIEPYHYYLLVVKGRTSDSNGVYLTWLANNMLQHGVQEGINLDGGGTTAIVFMGQILNWSSVKQLRQTTSITGFGVSDQVPEK
ncbi:MAG: phosphodiester glycosidase family protein [Clostridia bacterium]|nr:phosphodiester glycosidase family protein [Clostridia bacterium]